jgi:molybdate transport system substrate-binding protein
MKPIKTLFVLLCLLAAVGVRAEKITVAAAADLKFAMDEIVGQFHRANPGDEVSVVYGSSGKFFSQIQQNAPFDMYFSADINYPRELAKAGFAASEVKPYAIGRLVIWSMSLDASKLSLQDLADAKVTRIAIANPRHAPYGKRAEEALRAVGVWDKVEPKLIYGENISVTAQYVLSGNAQVGLIAMSLVVGPELSGKGSHSLVDDKLHPPLEQGFIITRRGGASKLARRFADYMGAKPARAVMSRYGFVLPGEPAAR